jgi:hypothetical protein
MIYGGIAVRASRVVFVLIAFVGMNALAHAQDIPGYPYPSEAAPGPPGAPAAPLQAEPPNAEPRAARPPPPAIEPAGAPATEPAAEPPAAVHQLAPETTVFVASDVAIDTSGNLRKIGRGAESYPDAIKDELLSNSVETKKISSRIKKFVPPREDEYSFALNGDPSELVAKLQEAYPVDGALALLTVSERGDYVITAAYLLTGDTDKKLTRLYRRLDPAATATVNVIKENANCAAKGIANKLGKLADTEKINWITCSAPPAELPKPTNQQRSPPAAPPVARGMLDDVTDEPGMQILPSSKTPAPQQRPQVAVAAPPQPRPQPPPQQGPQRVSPPLVIGPTPGAGAKPSHPPSGNLKTAPCPPNQPNCPPLREKIIYPRDLAKQVFKSGLQWNPVGKKGRLVEKELNDYLQRDGIEGNCIREQMRSQYPNVSLVAGAIKTMSTPRALNLEPLAETPEIDYSVSISDEVSGDQSDPRACSPSGRYHQSLEVVFFDPQTGKTGEQNLLSLTTDGYQHDLFKLKNQPYAIAEQTTLNKNNNINDSRNKWRQTEFDMKFWSLMSGYPTVFRVAKTRHGPVQIDFEERLSASTSENAAIILVRGSMQNF